MVCECLSIFVNAFVKSNECDTRCAIQPVVAAINMDNNTIIK